MFCPRWGFKFRGEAMFCGQCGVPASTENVQIVSQPAQPAVGFVQSLRKK